MKIATKSLGALLLLLGASASAPALAHGVRFGIGIGVPFYPPAYYYPPPPYYYYQPPVIIQTQPPPVYIERAPAQAAPAPEQYWYYCTDSKTYYPYVKQCPSPWQKVVPQAPG